MNILFLHQYFKTPEQEGARRSYYLASALAKADCRVKVITSRQQKEAVFPETLPPGLQLRSYYIPYSNHFSWTKRLWAFVRYASIALRHALGSRYDWLYATSTPLTVGFVAYVAHRLRGKPYVFESRDLWPEIPFALGFLKRLPFVQRILYWLTKQVYKHARLVVAVSPSMKAHIKKHYGIKHVVCVPNMADDAFFEIPLPAQEAHPLRMLYAGSLGDANDCLQLLRLIHELPPSLRQQIRFSIMGEGKQKNAMQDYIARQGLRDVVEWLPTGNAQAVQQALQAHDIFWVSFAPIPWIDTGSPNKFFEGLAAGRICFSTLNGWTAHLLQRYCCGFIIHNAAALQKAIEAMQDVQQRVRMQKNARQLAQRFFHREKLTHKWLLALTAKGLLQRPAE
ncbi:glycosyltransferase involved in cell wall biosynthesis [Thermonema lapsum]|uniref:Glycosyltransferase involved in cell wall biosynthesis n=1 Tax=Thermonema lapsum TaxID=28195 RepID=A0A846MPQ5_9BACT|nr:glycosyltransferase family 4 protein [Thermonema lapsum]NIK73435.1 glycosyltransferase involved in cell wall biosynthesis [Thermonema lapsum]